MPIAIDHAFLTTTRGAPLTDALLPILTEGLPNRHPGQGTANRRFFFHNFMLEFLWIEDPAETLSPQTRDTRLHERFTSPDASPFGIILRPPPNTPPACPFPSWIYRPPTMPGFSLHIASTTAIDEPMWCYMETGRPPATPPEHPAGIRDLTLLRLTSPPLPEDSITRQLARLGLIAWEPGPTHHLDLEFDHAARDLHTDFRPALPLTFHW